MTLREKTKELLKELRTGTNGAVVGSMEEKGIRYDLNYGVSIPFIRQTARRFFPDTQFACHLYGSGIRELMLASFSIAAPEELTPDDIGFWIGKIKNVEIAENIASLLLCRTGLVGAIFEDCYKTGSVFGAYAGLLTVAGYCRQNGRLPEWDFGSVSDIFREYSFSHNRSVTLGLLRFYESGIYNTESFTEYGNGFFSRLLESGTDAMEYVKCNI